MFKKEYKITLGNDDWVTPEETLMDSNSEHSDLETPISPNVFGLVLGLTVIFFGVILLFSFRLSVLGHAQYAQLALENKSVNFFVPPPRGMIFDRLGRTLAQNTSSFDLLVISKEVRESVDRLHVEKAAEILGSPPEDFKSFISENSKNNSVFFAAKELNKNQVLEFKYSNPKGFYIVPNNKRRYPDGHQFSSVLGYVGKVNKEDLEDDYYKSTDIVGRLGIEAQYEDILRGEHGKIFFSKNSDEKLNSDPVPGRNLVLNIDYELQKKLYNELYGALVGAGLSRGAAIIQNPSNGQVLALASFPSYDNNLFVSGLSERDFRNLFESKSRPLFNRVISGLYNPGSTIKPFMGLMTLQEKIFEPSDNIRDCVSLTIPNPFNPDAPYVFKNWREERGLFNLRKAIANSCNVYFYIAGGGFGDIPGLGIERIAKYLTLSWVNKALGIDIPGESKGFVPTPDWKEETKGEPWYQGDTYNTSIGQGDLLVTPLWLNSYISGIANGGTIFQPEIAQRVVDDQKKDIRVFEKKVLFQLPFDKNVINEIKSDMEETVISGTAKLLQNLPVRVGAKTGTAEVVKGRSVNSLFSAFAPFENPELSITVLIEGSSANQGLAIVVTDRVMEWYFGGGSKPAPSPSPDL